MDAKQLIEAMRSQRKRWVEVAANGETLGWVFGNFLDCSGRDDKLKSAPMHPRSAPQ